jgi:hypothetical protein
MDIKTKRIPAGTGTLISKCKYIKHLRENQISRTVLKHVFTKV